MPHVHILNPNPRAVTPEVSAPPPDAPTVREAKFVRIESDEDFAIEAGKIRVEIRNVGAVNGGKMAVARVNGDPINVGGQPVQFEAVFDSVSNELIKSPTFKIETNGATIWANYYE